MKKRQCVLCPTGKVETDVPKDKAVCRDCAIEMMDVPPDQCSHKAACDCPCHTNPEILHDMACCHSVECPHCGKRMDDVALPLHLATCHKTLLEFQTT